MVNTFVDLIIAKRKTFADVPNKLSDAVEAELVRRGYDTDGNPLAD